MVRLDGYAEVVKFMDPRYYEYVIITPNESSWSANGHDTSQDSQHQSLAPCWAMTMHETWIYGKVGSHRFRDVCVSQAGHRQVGGSVGRAFAVRDSTN